MNALARELHALDPNLAPLDAITLQQQVDRMSYTQRLAVALLAIFGGMALFLACDWALRSHVLLRFPKYPRAWNADCARRRHRGLLRLVFARGLRLTRLESFSAAIAALILTRLMGNLLYKVSPHDPLAFGSALVVIAIASLAACFLPAWRATRIDPVQALREQ